MKKNLALFASGSGTNVQNIAEYFKDHENIKVSLVLSNKEDAYVLERARMLNIPSVTFNRQDFYESDQILNLLIDHKIDLIVLAGFLWLVPDNILKAYSWRIINIHPALLPKYGGKGMYGDKVHQAVKESGDRISGITIHYVDEHYDEGKIIFQAICEVLPDDTPESIAKKVHVLEYEHYPRVVEEILLGGPSSSPT